MLATTLGAEDERAVSAGATVTVPATPCWNELATRELGGALHFGPFDTPVGRIAVVGDPQGAHVDVIGLTTPM